MVMDQAEQDREPRDEILGIAARLFSERGFSNVSIRDICEDAGVTPPTIYHYFGNKDQLFQEVIRSRLNLDDFHKTLIENLNAQPDPTAQLCTFIYHYLNYFPRDFFNPGMFLQDTTRISGLSFERVSTELEAIDRVARGIIQSGMDAGVFRRLDPDYTTRYLMNLLMSYVLGEVHYNQPSQPHETALFIQAIFLNGIRSGPSLTFDNGG
jgi:AcrR family transcriptional regulator